MKKYSMILLPALFNNTNTQPFADNDMVLDISQYDTKIVALINIQFIIPYYIGSFECTMIQSGDERFIIPLTFHEVIEEIEDNI